MSAPYTTLTKAASIITEVVDRQQDRDLRAAAWRHCRRINAHTARRIWRAHRIRQAADLLFPGLELSQCG